MRHQYAERPEELEIHFFAAKIAEKEITPRVFEQIAWVLPKELAGYDFLAANRELIAHLATGRIKPGEIIGVGRRGYSPQRTRRAQREIRSLKVES